MNVSFVLCSASILAWALAPASAATAQSSSAPGVAARATVTTVPTTTTLAVTSGGSAVTSVAAGAVMTLTATVAGGGAGVNPGTVKFCNAAAPRCTDTALIGTAQLTPAGTAAYRFRPGIGIQSYKAIFVGTTSYASSTSSASSLTVTGKVASSTTIAQSGSAGNYTLTATVTGKSSGFPSGNVSFLDTSNSNAVLASPGLVAGTRSVSFTELPGLATPTTSQSVAVADFNGDGIPDLAITNTGTTLGSIPGTAPGSLAIFKGKGDGTFTALASPATGPNPTSVVVGDFNGDGIPDLAVSNRGEVNNSLTILKGNGDGTFTPLASPPTGVGSWSVAVSDFNGDGIQDLVVVNLDAGGSVNILQGNGDGTFTALASPTVGANVAVVAVADFNGDGIPDIVVAPLGGSLNILKGNGDGTFTTVPSAIGNAYTSVVAADFNGDGIPDLALVSIGQNVSILKGNGDCTFTQVSTAAAGVGAWSVAVGDFNGDGIPDLAVGAEGVYFDILLGFGDGTFTEVTPSIQQEEGQGASVAVGDFNGDGTPDFVVTGYRDDYTGIVLVNRTATATATSTGISPVGNGSTHQVDASFPGGTFYSSSVSSIIGLTSMIGTKTITFPQPPGQEVGTSYTLTATASNGDPVTYSVTSGPASISGSVVSYTGAGPVVIAANSAASTNYAAAATVSDTVTIVSAPTTTSLAVTSGGSATTSVAAGAVVTLTATVAAGGAGVHPGTVKFCNAAALRCTDTALLGTAQLTTAGTATFKFRPGIGAQSYKAIFVGTTSYTSSTSSASSLTVAGTNLSSTAIAQSGSAASYTLTATVTGNSSAFPTGIVTFVDTSNSNAVLGAGNLVAGTSSIGFPNAPTPAAGGVSFVSSPTNPANFICFVVVADFNGDGIPDLAVTNYGDKPLAILQGKGDGTFTVAFTSSIGAALSSVLVGDFDGDGIPDLAVTYSVGQTATVSILRGKGDGTFTVLPSPVSGYGALAVGDFNGDGIQDLAAGNNGNIAILQGNGDGTFTALASTSTVAGRVAVGDFNGDGIQDLAVTNGSANTVAILQGKGDGTFTALASLATGSGPGAVVVLDFNGDGNADLAVLNFNVPIYLQNTITILKGNGDGTFTPFPSVYLPPGSSHGLQLTNMLTADFNGDGIPDLLIDESFGTGAAVVLKGNGDGTFTGAAATGGFGAVYSIAVGDFNGDGIPDVVVGGIFATPAYISLTGRTATATATSIGISIAGNGSVHNVDAGYVGDSTYSPSVSTTTGLVSAVNKGTPTGPAGYTYCAPENGTCSLSGLASVAFGANGAFNYGTFSSAVSCSYGVFGDPIFGSVKACFYQLAAAPSPPPPPAGPSGYTYCAPENGTCSLTGSSSVAYGAAGVFNYGTFPSAVSCSNNVFGDPLFGMVKACFFKLAPPPAPPAPPVGPSGYTYCAPENGACNITSLSSVAYGANGSFNYGTFASVVSCSNTVFSDPLYGTAKSCFYKPADPSLDPSFTYCAAENGVCSFNGTATVAYGVDGTYNYGSFTGSVVCTNTVFTDPFPGVVKACYYRPN